MQPPRLHLNEQISPRLAGQLRKYGFDVTSTLELGMVEADDDEQLAYVVSSEPRITALQVTDDSIIAQLADGRTISVPLAWSWRLSEATPQQSNNFEIMGNGQGVHWPDVDEDISAWGMLYGAPARRPKRVRKPQRRKAPSTLEPMPVLT